MKILIVCSGNSGQISSFIKEQAEFLIKKDITVAFFLIKGKGFTGYMKNLKPLKREIKTIKPDIVHAHFGLSGLLAGLQRITPVVLTLHGSDVNVYKNRILSNLAILLSKRVIFVSKAMADKMVYKNGSVIPCGVDFSIFKPMNKEFCKKKHLLNTDKKYILFSSRFDNKIKNYNLAKQAFSKTKNSNVELIELNNYSRQEVAELMNAVDLCLLTSKSEGSPQFIKEAMTCNCPIVSTNVGDVKQNIDGIDGCYITSYDPNDVEEKIKKALKFGKRTNGRERIFELKLDNESIAKKIIEVYNIVMNNHN